MSFRLCEFRHLLRPSFFVVSSPSYFKLTWNVACGRLAFLASNRAASTESAPYVGAEFCTNSLVQKVSFTGSTRVGKILMEQSSSTVKRLSLELGGNAPFVVFEDADIDNAVNAAMSSKFRNAGQTCVCADRFLIHASVHDEFVSKLVQKVEATTVGDGMEEGTQMGPLISEMALKSVADKVLEAIEQDGAILQTGGPSQASSMMEKLGPQFYPLTVLTDVAPNSRIWKTETFGPVVPVRSFETEDEALQLANDSSVGLAAYFCTKDLSRAFRFAQRYVPCDHVKRQSWTTCERL